MEKKQVINLIVSILLLAIITVGVELFTTNDKSKLIPNISKTSSAKSQQLNS
ncbi:hypothetical protein [Mycoplasma sp. P36-A1]|uniref:hypothetical protein n=1 Tax=Mycoplasma sp. P36-A1 TaxID=3252900 RepID=UPI003C2C990F